MRVSRQLSMSTQTQALKLILDQWTPSCQLSMSTFIKAEYLLINYIWGFNVTVNSGFISLYIISYTFIAPSRRNDAHNKSNLRIKPNNLDSVQRGIELRVCCSLQYIKVQGDKGIEPLLLNRDTISWLRVARTSAGDRSNSVEGRVLNTLSYLENNIYLAGRKSRSSAI